MADIIKTRADLVQRCAEKLGVVEAGQTISGEDSVFIDDKVDAALESLNEDSIVYVGDIEQIQVGVFEDIATLIAMRFLAKDYGITPDENLAMLSERRLRRMSAVKPTGEVLKAEYF